MTADPPGPRDDRERLIAACEARWPDAVSNQDTVDALLPVVDAIAEARAVARAQAELRAAAEALDELPAALRARADGLGQP